MKIPEDLQCEQMEEVLQTQNEINPYEADETHPETFHFTSCFRVDGLSVRHVGFNVEQLGLKKLKTGRELTKSETPSRGMSTPSDGGSKPSHSQNGKSIKDEEKMNINPTIYEEDEQGKESPSKSIDKRTGTDTSERSSRRRGRTPEPLEYPVWVEQYEGRDDYLLKRITTFAPASSVDSFRVLPSRTIHVRLNIIFIS